LEKKTLALIGRACYILETKFLQEEWEEKIKVKIEKSTKNFQKFGALGLDYG